MTDNNNGSGNALDINVCGLCGKAFVGAAGTHDVCENCKHEEQDIYDQVRDLIRDNVGRSITIEDASRLLHIPEKKIQHLVDKGLVQLDSSFEKLRSLFK